MNSSIAIILALIAPLIWAFMNTLDKFVVSKKAKNPLSFTVVAGLVNLIIGIVLALLIKWPVLSFKTLIYPCLAGLVFGSQFFVYYLILKREDASHSVGLLYSYPILLSVLSYIFINEKLSIASYFGVLLIIFGVLAISLRLKEIKLKTSLIYIIMMIIAVALYEFFIKLSSENLPVLNGLSIHSMCIWLAICPALLSRRVRKNFLIDLKNIKWAMINESLTFLGLSITYFAMSVLPATIVSSLGATQPLAVLFFEWTFNKKMNEVRDLNWLKKLISLILIVVGVVIVYLGI